jgi:hypothetical protein
VLGLIFDSDFSARGYGFRPGRSVHEALQHLCHELEEGYRGVVNIEMEKFFGRVNYDPARYLGVIPRGTKVRLVSVPIARSREFTVENGAQVGVPPILLR